MRNADCSSDNRLFSKTMPACSRDRGALSACTIDRSAAASAGASLNPSPTMATRPVAWRISAVFSAGNRFACTFSGATPTSRARRRAGCSWSPVRIERRQLRARKKSRVARASGRAQSLRANTASRRFARVSPTRVEFSVRSSLEAPSSRSSRSRSALSPRKASEPRRVSVCAS